MATRLNLKSHKTYLQSFRGAVEAKLKAIYEDKFPKITMETLHADQSKILKYPALKQLRQTQNFSLYSSILSEGAPLVQEAKWLVAEGRLLAEHTIGGMAERLGDNAKTVKFGYKFFITPEQLAEEINATDFRTLLPIPLGERHMLQAAFSIYNLAREIGADHWTEVLGRLKMLIIPNEETEFLEQLLETFKKYDFFGFRPENIMFAPSKFYPGLVLEKGELIPDEDYRRIHNHGIVPMQLGMDGEIFTIDPTGKRHIVPRNIFEEILKGMRNKISYPVEDLDYLTNPIDYKGLAIAMKFASQGYKMVMEIVGQRAFPLEPQKGGKFCFDPNLFDEISSQKGKNVIVESFQLGLQDKPSESDPDFALKKMQHDKMLRNAIQLLNRNFNQFPDPFSSYKIVTERGLPVHPEIHKHKDGSLRIYNLTPQGDINHLVPTAYVFRDKGIRSLKGILDIPMTLEEMKRQDTQEGFVSFLSQFSEAGVVSPDYSFSQITRLDSSIPLGLETMLAHPWITKRLEPAKIQTLEALSEVFKVDGSLVYSVKQVGDKVFLQVNQESRRGTGLKYKSRAETEAEALDFKNTVFKEFRVWTGGKQDLSYILICNRKEDSEEGEIVLLLGNYNEDISNSRKPVLLAPRLEKVLQYARGKGIKDSDIERMRDEFQELSWQFLFENSATVIEIELENRLGIKK